MRRNWETHLESWLAAGVVDAAVAGRIRAWESRQERQQNLRWPTFAALAFGALLLGSGVLLFVSAHWDNLAAVQRMTLVLAMVAAFHIAGAVAARRFDGLSIALHAVGTAALGAGIALAGQIFHLSEHWPAAIMLWAAGAAFGWFLLGHWTQAAMAAILVPWWLIGEWYEYVRASHAAFMLPAMAGACALSLTYLSARRSPDDNAIRRALGWIGGIALLPTAAIVAAESWTGRAALEIQVAGWLIAILLPGLLAWVLRRRDAVWNVVAIAWVLLLAAANGGHGADISVYFCCVLGAVWLVYWGIRETRTERVNLGVAGFALTVLAFYFSTVMDKIGRSASLIGLGLLFLAGGWALEKTRRRLVSQIRQEVR